MKRFTLFLFLAIGVLSTSQAQYSNTNSLKHGIKLNTTSLLWSNVGLNYEYVINDKSSIQGTATMLIPRTAFSYVEGTVNSESGGDGDVTTNRLMGFGIHAEYRMYTKEEAPDGFYWGPFARFYRYSINYNVENVGSENYYYDNRLGIQSISAGVQIGYQWIIGDNFSIDWSFAGLGPNHMNIFGKFSSDDPDQSTEGLDDAPVVGNRVKVKKVDDETLKISAPFFWVAWRSSLKISYFF